MESVGLSQEVLNLIRKFVDKEESNFATSNVYCRLAASLCTAKCVKEKRDFQNGFKDLCYSFMLELPYELASAIERDVIELTEYLEDEEIEILLANYTEVVDYCLDFNRQAKYRGFYTQPKELTKFCSQLLNMKEGAEVYNPFAGFGSYAIDNPQCSFFGEDEQQGVCAFMQINLEAHQCKANYKVGDSFTELEDATRQYDYVITTPPFGVRRDDRYTEADVVKLAMKNKLKEGGSLLIVLPAGFCFQSNRVKSIREYLVKNGYLTAVIELSSVFALYTGINICVILAKKEKQEGFVLVDGREYVSKTNRTSVFNYQALLEAINNRDSRVCTEMLTAESLDENFNLTPPRFVYKLPPMENPTQLSQLVKLCNRLMGITDLFYDFGYADWANPVLKLLRREASQHRRPCFVYDGDCLITRMGIGVPKTGKLNDQFRIGDSIVIYPLDIVYKIIRKDLVDESYLRLILESEEVSAQISNFTAGVVPKISSEDFRSITIPLPPLSEQKRIVKAKMDKIMQQKGVSSNYSDLAHMLGTPFSKISGALGLLQRAELSEKEQRAVKSIKANLDYVSRLLDLNMDVRTWKNNQKSVCLFDFLNCYIENWNLYGANTFQVNVAADDNVKAACIRVNEDALTIMFDCLLDNANRHGFRKHYKPENEVRFDMMLVYKRDAVVGSQEDVTADMQADAPQKEKPYIMLKVGNNGEPISPNFSLEDYITKGRFDASTGRSGLGGNHVYSIAQSTGGELSSIRKMSNWTDFEFLIPIVSFNQ